MSVSYRFAATLLVASTLSTAASAQQLDRKVIPIVTSDIAYIPQRDRLYATRPDDVEGGNSISVINPYFGSVEQTFFIGASPSQLAITADGEYLWVGLDGDATIARYNIATGNTDKRIKLIGDDRATNGLARAKQIVAHPTRSDQVIVVQVSQDNPNAQDGTVELYAIGVDANNANTGTHLVTASTYAAPVRQVLYDATNDRLLGFASRVNEEVIEYTLTDDGLARSRGFNLPGDRRASHPFATANGTLYHPGGYRYALGDDTITPLEPYEIAAGRLTYVRPMAGRDEVDYIEVLAAPNEQARAAELLTFGTADTTVLSRQPVGPLFYDVRQVFSFGEAGGLGLRTFGEVVLLRECTSTITAAPQLTQTSQVKCDGNPVTLRGPDGLSTYYWSNGATSQNITIYETGKYTLATGDASGCLSPTSDTLDIAIERTPAAPTVDANGAMRAPLCTDGSVGLRAVTDAGNLIRWSNGDTGPVATVTEVGTYTAVASSPSGCESGPSMVIEVYAEAAAAPAVPTIAVPNQGAICSDNSVQLTATADGATGYRWSNGADDREITVFTVGSYSVQALGANGCGSAFSEATVIGRGEVPETPALDQQENELVSDQTGTHRWFLDGVELVGESEGSLTLRGFGIYTAQQIVNGCASTMSEPFVVVNVATVNLASDAELRVWPNPASAVLHVRASANAGPLAAVELFSSTGQLVARSSGAAAQEVQVAVRDLAPGVYALRCRSQNGTYVTVRRVVVDR